MAEVAFHKTTSKATAKDLSFDAKAKDMWPGHKANGLGNSTFVWDTDTVRACMDVCVSGSTVAGERTL